MVNSLFISRSPIEWWRNCLRYLYSVRLHLEDDATQHKISPDLRKTWYVSVSFKFSRYVVLIFGCILNIFINISCVPVCGPGQYYGQIGPTNVYCRVFYGKTQACVQCPGNKVKPVSGNSQSLCVDCDGTTTVAKSDRTGCGKCRTV